MDEMREAAFTRIMGDVTMPDSGAPDYDQWLFNKTWQAALAHRDAQREIVSCDCDDGVDWSSGEAKVCEDCEGAGNYSVPASAPLPTPPQPIYDKVNLHFNEVKLEAKDE